VAPVRRPPPAERGAHLGQSLSAPIRSERQAAARRSQQHHHPRQGPPGHSSPWQCRYHHHHRRLQRAPVHAPAPEQPHPARLRRSGRVVAGSSRPARLWRLPSWSLQRLPRDHPFRSPGRSAPRRARRLAGRAGSRHRHPVPHRQDNKAEHAARTRAACQAPEDTMTAKSDRLPRPPPPHYAESAAARTPPGHPDNCRICPHPPQPLSFPPVSPDDLMRPGFPGVGSPDSGHATGWIWLARSSSSIRVNMPSDEGQPRRLRRDRSRRAGPGGRRPRCDRPEARPRARPAGSSAAPGRLAVTPAARAGSPLTTLQHHHDSRAAPVVTVWHGRTLDGRSASATESRARPGTRPGPGVRSSRTRWPDGESSSCRAVSQPHGFQPRAFPDSLARQVASADPSHGRRRRHNQEVKDDAGHCEVVERRQRLRLHRGRERPGRVRALQRDHRHTLAIRCGCGRAAAAGSPVPVPGAQACGEGRSAPGRAHVTAGAARWRRSPACPAGC
jgi:hypothetical protein